MTLKLSFEEMKKKYPNEWLMIVDFECDQYGEVKEGVVLRHSTSKDEVYKPIDIKKDIALRYTGESTFHRLRRDVNYYH